MKHLPNITTVDSLLNLLADPDKVQGYLVEMRAYRDEMKSLLAIAQTEDQAKKIANEAVTKRAEAERYYAENHAAIRKEREAWDADYSRRAVELRNQEVEWTAKSKDLHDKTMQFEQWRTTIEADIATKQGELLAEKQALDKRLESLQKGEQELAARMMKLEAAMK